MSDPTELLEGIAAAEDAFSHASGRPKFEPEINAAADADDGEVQIQKACRLLVLAHEIDSPIRTIEEIADLGDVE